MFHSLAFLFPPRSSIQFSTDPSVSSDRDQKRDPRKVLYPSSFESVPYLSLSFLPTDRTMDGQAWRTFGTGSSLVSACNGIIHNVNLHLVFSRSTVEPVPQHEPN
jgi:hypothetical protein